jgi:hypothetical protein
MREAVIDDGTTQQKLPSASHEPHRCLLCCAVLAALAVRLVVIAFVYSSFMAPEREHWLFGFEIGKIAQSIVQGDGFANLFFGGPTGPTSVIAPVFPYIVAGIFELLGVYTKASAMAILALNSLFSALTCIPIYFVAKKSFGARIAQWATWGWALFPYAIYFSADSMWYHALATLLVSCIFWAAMGLPGSSRMRSWIAFGALCGFSALVSPAILGVSAVLGIWACYGLHHMRRPWLRPAIVSVAVVCAVIAPWLVRNYRAFGKPVFLKDNLPLELCVGNIGSGLYWFNSAMHPSGSPAQMEEFRLLGEQGYMARDWLKAREFIADHPATFGWLSIRRFGYFWAGFWSFNRKYLEEESFDLVDIPFRTAVTVLMLIGIRRAFQRNAKAVMPYLLMLLVYPFPYYVTHPEIAYRSPIDPEIVILACCILLRSTSNRKTTTRTLEVEFASDEMSVQALESR